MIKEVTEIPKPNCMQKGDKPRGYYQELVFNDIKEAYTDKIKMFELVGYDVKPNYLAQVARSEAYNVCRELLYIPSKNYVRRKLSKELNIDASSVKCLTPNRYSGNKIIKVYGVTLKDGIKHVYCEIDFKAVNTFNKELLEDSRNKTVEAVMCAKKKLKRKYNTRK